MTDDLAHQVIAAYLDRQETVAREVARKAAAARHEAILAVQAWNDRQELTPHPLGDIDLIAYSIVGDADAAYHAAARAAIPEYGGSNSEENLTAAEDAKERAAAVRAWFRKRGINYGEDEKPKRGRR